MVRTQLESLNDDQWYNSKFSKALKDMCLGFFFLGGGKYIIFIVMENSLHWCSLLYVSNAAMVT